MRKLIPLFAALGLVASLPAQATDVITTSDAELLYSAAFDDATPTRVSVHDPSVVIGYEAADGKVYPDAASGRTKVYCIFGSHRAFAKSYDMAKWTTFTNNISTNYATIFATDAAYSAHGSSSYSVDGNLWAPDVIWNKSLGKWCMYMSVNGDNFFSSIVLLTAESLTGDWTRVGTVVYSLGNKSTWASETDVYDILGSDADLSRYYYYRNSTSNHTYGTNAIDPCVFYDEEGGLWMSYGSWFGGLYLLKLDESTGLRDKTYTYDTDFKLADNATAGKMNVEWAKSDAYQGIKIAGGNHCSGEASYIEYHDGRYWLFVTYGGLTATGGYNMRVFSSESVTGPYTDISGDDARYSTTGTNGSTNAGQINRSVGTRLMSYYRWGFMNTGYTAQGHNSAVVDSDGKMYLVFHTRFDDGTEGHQVRVHQIFTTTDGRITCAPFEYRGETLSTSAYTTSQVAGFYGIIRHGNGTDYANLVCATEEVVELKADGTIGGAYTGSWTLSSTAPEVTISIKAGSTTETYKGLLLEQTIEETNVTTICFTAVDDIDKSLWGYKRGSETSTFADDLTVAAALHELDSYIPQAAFSGSKMDLPSSIGGATVTYKSQSPDAISDDGLVSSSATMGNVVFDVTVSCGNVSCQTTVAVAVMPAIADIMPLSTGAALAHYATDGAFDSKPAVSISHSTGLSLSFLVNNVASDWDVIAHSADGNYNLHLAVLHYGGTDYYEHLGVASAAAQTAMTQEGKALWQLFLGGTYYVTVSYGADGAIRYYRNGELILTFNDSCTAGYVVSGTTTQKPSDIVKAVIDDYLAGSLIFNGATSNVVVGYATDYSAPDLTSTCPVADSNILTETFSDVTLAYVSPSQKVSTETGLSFSFMVSGLTSDWDLVGQTADGNYHMLMSVLHYAGTDYYEHLGIVSDEATAAISSEGLEGPYQLFLGSTHYATVSFNPNGSISYYRDGVLMITFTDDCTAGYVASGTTAQKPSDIVKAVIAAYKAGEFAFTRSATSIKIGYAVGYDSTATSDIVMQSGSNVTFCSMGNSILAEGMADGDVMEVYDMAGRRVATSRSGVATNLPRGLYIARTASASGKVLIQ